MTAMGFVWKVRDKGTGPGQPPSFSIRKQHQILKIIQVQYILQGHTKFTTLPRRFVAPSSSEWPQQLHGCLVHTPLFRKAYQLALLDTSIVAKLDAMKFVWNDSQHQWNLTMEALQKFKKINGHANVPSRFEVPEDDPVWSNYLWGMKLGSKVCSIRSERTKLTLEKRQELDKQNFIWNARELRWNRILSALKTYKEIHDDLYVPQKFVVPRNDPGWPLELVDMKLGMTVSDIRRRKATISNDLRTQLDTLGFAWSGKV
ncbi:Phosphatidate phosphatase lpin1 [Aphanomyces cochlioides]|nr:Phosphatidate phosphatase lpin1 [Aphanomyces cochlioides]